MSDINKQIRLAHSWAMIGDNISDYNTLFYSFIKGYESAMKWYDINDRENPCPSNQDFLIKLEDGSIRRYKEDWEDNMLIVTHWKPIN